MKTFFPIALTALVLASCGGSGSSTNGVNQNDKPAPDAVATASEQTATAAGLSVITTGNPNQTAYDVAADIGDTWRIVLDASSSTFTVKVLNTLYSLNDRAGTFTVSTSGNITTYSGPGFKLQVDNRTKSVKGDVDMGTKKATVGGSGYAIGDITKLTGTYLFVGVTRNVSGGADLDRLKGMFKFDGNGTILACDGGVFNQSGACSRIPGLPEPAAVTLTMKKNSGTGVVSIKQGEDDFGVLHVQAGDRGPVLVIDRFGLSRPVGQGTPVMRAGTIYAAKQQKVAGELDGRYACSSQGGEIGTMVVSGATNKITNLGTGKSHDEDVSLNKISDGSKLIDLDGTATFLPPGSAQSQAATALPLSSSMFVEATFDSPYLVLCMKQ